MNRWSELLFDNGFEEHYHFHVGMRIIKTAIAVFICGLIGWIRGEEMNFFAMIAAVICIQKSTEATIKNSFNRVIGTAIGGFYGVLVLFCETQLRMQRFMPAYIFVVSAMMIPIIVTTLAIHKRTVTGFSCIVFLSIAVYHVTDASPYTYALNRLLDTTVGIVVAFLVNVIMPGATPIKPPESAVADVKAETLDDKVPETSPKSENSERT